MLRVQIRIRLIEDHIEVAFPYEQSVVEAVKRVPGRRWDPGRRVWRIPATPIEADALLRSLWETGMFSPGKSGPPAKLLAEESAPRPPLPATPADRIHRACRVRRYSRDTEKCYVAWIRRFIAFSAKSNERDLEPGDIGRFLSFLAGEEHVAASTQNQALSALLFYYRDLLGFPEADLSNVVRARKPRRLPVVLSADEVARLLSRLRPGRAPGRPGKKVHKCGRRVGAAMGVSPAAPVAEQGERDAGQTSRPSDPHPASI